MDKNTPLGMQIPQAYEKAVEDLLEQMAEPIQLVVLNTACFGWAWKDGTEICPEQSCAVRKRCEAVWNSVENQVAESLVVNEVKPAKYQRNSYVALGRAVDEYARVFVHELGYPKELPQTWAYQNLKAGAYGTEMLLAKTASYHSLFRNKQMIIRFWTNAASYAIVDVHPVLVRALSEAGFSVTKVPEKSFTKSKPCVFRVHCSSIDQAVKLAEVIKKNV